jgi:hypothetical protein
MGCDAQQRTRMGKNNHTQGVIATQAWSKETETELSHSGVLSLPDIDHNCVTVYPPASTTSEEHPAKVPEIISLLPRQLHS